MIQTHSGVHQTNYSKKKKKLTNLLTNSIEQDPSWEATRLSASQEIPPVFHYRIHKSPLLVLILRQINPVHTPKSTTWRSILILSSHQRFGLTRGLFLSGFRTKKIPVYTSVLPHTFYMSRSSHSYSKGKGILSQGIKRSNCEAEILCRFICKKSWWIIVLYVNHKQC